MSHGGPKSIHRWNVQCIEPNLSNFLMQHASYHQQRRVFILLVTQTKI